MTKPQDCTSMAELRTLIDRIDRDLVGLLVERQACIDRAVEIKRDAGLPANIPDRVADVLDKVRGSATSRGLDPDLARQIWTLMIAWSIAREERSLGPGGGTEDGQTRKGERR